MRKWLVLSSLIGVTVAVVLITREREAAGPACGSGAKAETSDATPLRARDWDKLEDFVAKHEPKWVFKGKRTKDAFHGFTWLAGGSEVQVTVCEQKDAKGASALLEYEARVIPVWRKAHKHTPDGETLVFGSGSIQTLLGCRSNVFFHVSGSRALSDRLHDLVVEFVRRTTTEAAHAG